MKRSILFALVALAAYAALAQTKIAAKDVKKHLNETVMITDKVYSTKMFGNTGMVLLNIGAEYPHQYLTVVIKGEDRSKFNPKPDEYYKGRTVIVTGKLIEYEGRPEIVVRSPDALKLNMVDSPVERKVKVQP